VPSGLRPLLKGAILLLFAEAGCRKHPVPSLSFPDAPVVIVSIDTLRSDHLPMYGYGRVETPHMASFRKDAILFEKAYSHVPLTLPSHASLFTGQLPAVHGLRDNLGYHLSPDVPTLAEVLRKKGYATGGAVSCIVLSGESGIGRGFDFWEDSVEPTEAHEALSRVQRSGAETEDLLSGWLERSTGGKPPFAFLHLYEPHTPYEPPEPYATRYMDREYDGEIAWADELVGRFLDRLKARGLYDRALIIVLSDHGEGLGEHGEDEHGIFLYRWALQVPLMVKLPKSERAGTSIGTPVQLADVFTTVVQAVGAENVPAPAGTISLLDEAALKSNPARRIFSETLFPRIHFGWAETASLVDGQWQYIEAPRPELFDLVKDPTERTNLASGLPPAFRTLRIEMEKRRAGFTAPGKVDPEEAKKLASLGYLSSGESARSGPLPDAKDEISVIGDLRTGSGYLHTGRYAEAATALGKLVARNPRMMEVWDLYVQALLKMGRREEALDGLKKAIAAAPEERTRFLVTVAEISLSLGRLDDAERHAEIAQKRGDPAADDMLANIHLARREWDAAEKEAKASIAAHPNRRLPYLILARVEVSRNHLPEALALVEKARALPGKAGKDAIQNLHYLRGDILGRMNRPAEAEPEFLEEIRLFPDNLDAYAGLVALHASEGRDEEARSTIRKLLTANPNQDAYARAIKLLSVMGDRAEAERVRRAAAVRFPADRRFARPA
jgi:arylsulfatase A-like enzyme/Tfp pilus assembly protein PilF